MKLTKLALLAAFVCGINAANASDHNSVFRAALEGTSQPMGQVVPVGFCGDCDQPTCGCETACDPCDSCDACDSCGGGSCFSGLFGDDAGLSDLVHGWVQLGYHSHAGRRRFNDYDGGVRLHQAYLYAEKVADGSNGLGIGGRIDYIYGIDGPDTQAFGQGDNWDTGWDNGAFYGHALPQVYGEVAYGDTSVKIGHFYTLIGYEVVTAPGNFFYSHSYTMYNSEPFTHTGVLATHKLSDDVSVYGGYVMGWDSGFQDNGDSFLGGLSFALGENVNVIYATVAGRFDDAANGGGLGFNERGYMHSLISTVSLTDKLNYVFWTDYLASEDETGAEVRQTFDITQYLLYTINDKVAVGSRFEWWNVDSGALAEARGPGKNDVYVATFGVNYKAADNLLVRPEVRWDWDKDNIGVNENDAPGIGNASQATFGVDAILSF